MKHCLSVAVILLASITVAPQADPDPTKVEQVQSIAGALIGGSDKADILLNDLTELRGYVTRLDAGWFELKVDRKKRGGMKIHYTDVLAISSKQGSVSFVPDPGTVPYGDWSELRKVPTNTLIEVTHKNGEIRSGRYRSSAADYLVLSHRDKNEEWKYQRTDIAFVYRVKDGWRNTSDGIAGGSQKGEKIGKSVGQVLGGMRGPISGASTGNGSGGYGRVIGAGIGAVAGAAKGTSDKTHSLKVLVYSQ